MTTFRELFERFNIETRGEGEHHHARHGWLQLDCPFCGGGAGKFHLGFNISGQYFNCWSCGRHNTLNVLHTLTGKPFGECKQMVQGLDAPEALEREIDPRGKLVVPSGIKSMRSHHRNYLRDLRNLDPDMIAETWNVKGIGIASRLSWRLWIPIYHQGRIVSWTTRSVSDFVERRYISAAPAEEIIDHKTLLYGEDYARPRGIIIVEGPLDVWRIGPGAVGTFGVGFTKAQVLKMTKYKVRVVCFDNEPAAQKRARELCDMLEPFPGETIRVELDAKDPGSASAKEIRKLRREFLGSA